MSFIVGHIPGGLPSRLANDAKEAVCMDNLVLTMSSGYVNVTEVIPATPPHNNLSKEVRLCPVQFSAVLLYKLKEPNCTAEYGTILKQFIPLPLMKPCHPSSLHILPRALPTDIWYSFRPALWTWYKIFNLSRGETTVLETAPATPPAQKAAVKGVETNARKFNATLEGDTVTGFLPRSARISTSRRV